MPHLICTVTNDLTYDQRMQRIGRSLARAGYRVTLVGRARPSSRPLREEPYRQLRLRCRFERGKLFYLEYNLRLLIYLLSHPADMICAVDLDTLLPAFLTARLRGKPCIYDAHEYFTEAPELMRRPLIRWAWRGLARFLIPRLRHAYTVGPALARQLEQRYGVPFAVVRNLPEAQPPPPDPPGRKKPVILYQGALNLGRGLESAIAAMRQLADAELWLAGEGDLSGELRELTRRLGVEDRVRFLGLVQPAELKALTPEATVGLNLLENLGQSYYLSLANKAFDYVQAGVPSIQMDFPEYRNLNGQYEVFLLLSDLQPSTLAEAIRRLLSTPDYYRQLRANCLRARQQWSWENEEQHLLDFYRTIVIDRSA